MRSEKMRSELEVFINRGLKEGWSGWPLVVDPAEDAHLSHPSEPDANSEVSTCGRYTACLVSSCG